MPRGEGMPATPFIGRRRAARTLLVAGFAPVVALGGMVSPAAAADGDESRSGARFLDGEIFGTDLDEIAELAGVDVENLGDPEPVTEANPVDVTVLDSINLDIPGGVQLPLRDIVELGAVSQWATAEEGASSHAATGAVADNGGIGTGVEEGFPGDATFHLSDLIGDELTDLIAAVDLRLGAVSSEAHLTPDGTDDFAVERDYEIAGGELILTVPLLEGLGGGLGAQGLTPSQQAAMTKAEANGIDVDLKNGTIRINLDEVFEDLNSLPPNTELIGPELFDVLGGILTGLLGDQLGGGLGDLLDKLGVKDLTDGLGEALSSLLSIKVNVQPDQAESGAAVPAAAVSEEYSVAATKVTVLPEVEDGVS